MLSRIFRFFLVTSGSSSIEYGIFLSLISVLLFFFLKDYATDIKDYFLALEEIID